MLISDEYRELNRKLHAEVEHYGASERHIDEVKAVCDAFGTKEILDYGCGKGVSVARLKADGFNARGYDPSVWEFSESPLPADVVTCCDVLEHVEPEAIAYVIQDIHRLAKKAVFFSISTVPAKKTLADGRNAHLIVRPAHDWVITLWQVFEVSRFHNFARGLTLVGIPK